jgi:diguanylate cyclase (GGDEF)-like protein
VLSGRLSIRLDSAESIPITEIGEGESVGELSMIDHQPTSAFVVVETESRLLVLDEELVWVLANTSHAISTNLLFTLTKRIRFGNKLIFENHERLEQYRFYATVDGLTGLFNRHWLNSMLPRQMERSRICREPFSMLMADIDEFKIYNDRHGHVAGDRALAAVAETFRNTLRPSDMTVRYGGEEFLVLLPDCPLEAAQAVAERLRSAMADTDISLVYSNRELPSVTISVGVAEMPEHGTVEHFISAVDAALFQAKEAGRNCVST